MSPYELFDVAFSVGNRVDVQWGLFITIHLALFGGIIYVDRPLRLPEKVGAMVIYTAFSVLNYRVMRVQLDLLQLAHYEISKLLGAECCRDSQLVVYVAKEVASGRFEMAETILVSGHSLMAIVVVLSIIFDEAIGAKRLPRRPSTEI